MLKQQFVDEYLKKLKNYLLNTICISLSLNKTKQCGNVAENSVKVNQEMHLEAAKRPKTQRLAVFEF